MAGGRRSKRDEIAEFLEQHGLPLELLDGDSGEAAPTTIEELRDRLVKRVSQELAFLKGNALVNALRAVDAVIKATPPDLGESDGEPLIGDVLAGVQGLPVERRDAILRRELEKLDVERARIEEVLADV